MQSRGTSINMVSHSCIAWMQDAVQEHQRQTSRMLRDMPSAAAPVGQSAPVARSAPSESAAGRALERLSSSHGAAMALHDAVSQASATAGAVPRVSCISQAFLTVIAAAEGVHAHAALQGGAGSQR